jgi:glycerol-3-phosphate acyltransferase PlsY
VKTIILFIFSYLSGSLPTAYLITKLVKNVDIRKCGSGNPGATNVFRVAGTVPGIITLIIDLLKGYIPVIIAMRFFNSEYIWILAGMFALCGHIWTVFLNFKGGKGVATGTGVFLALLPVPTLITAGIFVAVFIFTRYISLSSIIGSIALPILSWLRHEPAVLSTFVTIICILIIIRHHSNIKRLLAGTELKLTKGEKTNG